MCGGWMGVDGLVCAGWVVGGCVVDRCVMDGW